MYFWVHGHVGAQMCVYVCVLVNINSETSSQV